MSKKITSFLMMVVMMLSLSSHAQVQKRLLNRAEMKVTTTRDMNKSLKVSSASTAKQPQRYAKANLCGPKWVHQQDENGIITSPGEGEHKYYDRSGSAYFMSGGQLYGTTQSGIVELVELEDGTIYIKDIISRYTQGTWVKGTKEGNTITVPSNQFLAYDATYSTTLSLWGIDVDEEGYVSKSANDIVFTVEDDVITLTNELIGIYWDDNDSWTGYGDFETIWTLHEGYEPPSTDLVELPAGATVEDWYASGKSDYGKVPLNVKVAFVGNDIYVSGIFEDFPESWIKGTIDGNTVSFPTLQYLGVYGGTMDIWLYVGSDYGIALSEATFTYDAEAKTMTLDSDQILFANAAADRVYYLSYIETLTISAEVPELPQEVTLPEGVTPEEYTLVLSGYEAYGPINSKKTRNVAFDGDDVYVQGLAYYFSDAYVKGTLNADGQYVFQSGQFVGEDAFGEEYLVGLDFDEEGDPFYIPEIVFDFDAETRELSLVTFYGESEVADDASIYSYFESAVYTPGAYVKPDNIEVPNDLVTDTYMLTAYDTYYDENVSREVQVGFYGDDEVYFHGLSEYVDSWVKGTIDAEGVVSIPETFLGIFESWFEDFEVTLPATQFTYNATEEKFFCTSFVTYDGFGFALDELSDVVLTKLYEVEATPANPSVVSFRLYNDIEEGDTELKFTNFPSVKFDIPAVDVNGQPMVQSKLSYIIYIVDAQNEQKPLTLTTDLYELFEEDLTEIPYTYADGWDLDQYGAQLFLNQDPNTIASWKKIGVQSIYRGLGVEHRSDIGWFDIEAYIAALNDVVTGISTVAADGNDVRFFDMQGRAADNMAKGLLIKQVRMADGTTKTMKVVRK